MNKENVNQLIDVLVALFDPVVQAMDDTESARAFFEELGYLPPSDVHIFDDFSSILSVTIDLLHQTDESLDSDGNLNYFQLFVDIIQGIRGIINTVNNIGNSIQNDFGADFLAQTGITQKFPQQLLDYLIINVLERRYPVFHGTLLSFGIIEETFVAQPPTPFNTPYTKREIVWGKIPDVLTKSVDALKQTYKWDSNDFDFQKLIRNLNRLGHTFGFHSEITSPLPDVLEKFNGGTDAVTDANANTLKILKMPLLSSLTDSIGVELYPVLNATKDKAEGLGLGVYFDPGPGLEFPISDNITFKIKYAGGDKLSAGLIFRKNQPVQIVDNVFNTGGSSGSNLKKFIPEFVYAKEDESTLLLDTSFGARLEFRSWAIRGGVADDSSVFVENDVKKLTLLIGCGDGDGFLQKILPAESMKIDFDLTAGFSSKTGLYFQGSAALEIRFPLHIDIGPITLQGLTVAIKSQDGKLPLALGADITCSLGPLVAVVENMGVAVVFSFPADRSGNLGPLQVDLGFKPPKGVGLSVDAGAVKGGGYLFFDPDRGEYGGALELVFSEWITLKAIGLITTKMPDGSKGFSLLIIITAEFGSGIQLGMGFALFGVGGLLGLNRMTKIEALKDGVRTGAVESVMFPQDVVANAPRIISDLQRFFPPMTAIFLVGPMAKIGWSTPPLVSVQLGIILEFPDVTITILGVLKAILPHEKADILRLQVNFIGRIEPANKLLWFYAELFDSRVLFITLEGGMGLLVNWGDNANFVISVGGFHPNYSPPPLPFPQPPRIAANILNTSCAKIRLEGYFAVTSNSVQFGARVEVFFGLSEFKLEGYLGFDALFCFNPFYFSFSLSFKLSVKVFGIGLFSVGFKGLLEGPTPWHIQGKGKISLLFFSISVPFEETWGDRKDTKLDPIDVFPLIEAEFQALTNWTAVLPSSSNLLVSLRQLGEADTDRLVLHPVGKLRVSQRRMPIDFKLEKIGNQRPADVNRITVSAAISGGGNLTTSPTLEKFAIGQYKELNEKERLSSAAFQLICSGTEMAVAGQQIRTSQAVKRIVRYETNIIDTNFKRYTKHYYKFLEAGFGVLNNYLFAHFLVGNAVTRSVLSQHYKNRTHPVEQVIKMKSAQYTVAYSKDNTPFDAGAASFSSQAKATEYMQQQVQNNPNLAGDLHVIPNTEVNITV